MYFVVSSGRVLKLCDIASSGGAHNPFHFWKTEIRGTSHVSVAPWAAIQSLVATFPKAAVTSCPRVLNNMFP